jgi:hypothetical protein
MMRIYQGLIVLAVLVMAGSSVQVARSVFQIAQFILAGGLR